jgi:hypothetical protein
MRAMPPTQTDTSTTSPPPTLGAALAHVLLWFMLLIATALGLAWLGS